MFDGFRAWRADQALDRLFLRYDMLPENPLVLDFGGFAGEWTDQVLSHRPGATSHIFEPHPKFAAALRSKFQGNDKVIVHDFALGATAGTLTLSDAGDASSALGGQDGAFTAAIVPVAGFFETEKLDHVDLAKINIEGGEYDLLPALIDSGLIARIDRLRVQFHLFGPELVAKRDDIRAALEKTHDCVWSYPFVWEEWRRRDPGVKA